MSKRKLAAAVGGSSSGKRNRVGNSDAVAASSAPPAGSSAPSSNTAAAPKDFSFFQNVGSQMSFTWLDNTGAPGQPKTCIMGKTGSAKLGKQKFAVFDMDGTLIKPQGGRVHPSNADDWQWWSKNVKARVANAYTKDGYAIVIISNQNHGLAGKKMDAIRKKVPVICKQINVPLHLIAAAEKDYNRKPFPGMWKVIESLNEGVQIGTFTLLRLLANIEDYVNSFYVGDAAGRSNDHSDSDLKFAINVGLRFLTPEEYFEDKVADPVVLRGIDVAKVVFNTPNRLLIQPCSSPIVPPLPRMGQLPIELVLFVGMPALGKTTFYRRFFQPRGYAHINQDTLGSLAKCQNQVREALSSGKSVVVDNTNRKIDLRRAYLDIANSVARANPNFGPIPVRCFFWTDSLQLAWHNNLYRAFVQTLPPGETRRRLIPMDAFTSFKHELQPPSLSEGFTELHKLSFVWDGSGPNDAEEKKKYCMWMALGGRANKSHEDETPR